MSQPRIAFAGDRDIAVWILEFLLNQGLEPLALLVSEGNRASHADQLISLCSHVGTDRILKGRQFRQPEGVAVLRQLNLDYIIGVHFPYIVPESILTIPRIGVLNLHPAYLPYNRGWHTPSWALLERTPVGATLHFMDTGLDTGDIVHQKQLQPSPGDTANSLYQRLKRLELEVFQEGWALLATGAYQGLPQPQEGTKHTRAELFTEHVQRIDLDETVKAESLIRRLRALTTNRIEEAAYYEVNGKRYRVQVLVHEEASS